MLTVRPNDLVEHSRQSWSHFWDHGQSRPVLPLVYLPIRLTGEDAILHIVKFSLKKNYL